MNEFNIKEEKRCDFIVSVKRKKVWKHELDMFEIFIHICKENNLTYWAFGGTLLGAIRHDGFIPWDDDIDVAMPRKDYDKFIELTENKLEYPFFFQTNKTDKDYFRGNVRIRNSETTAIMLREAKRKVKYNQGIWFSIFPLDAVPDSDSEMKGHIKKIMTIKNISRRAMYDNISMSNSVLSNCKIAMSKFIFFLFGKNTMSLIEKKIATKYENCNTKRIGQVTSFYERGEKACYLKEWFSKVEYHKFENLEIAIPYKYEEFLNYKYGNWHEYVVNASTHGKVLFDSEKSYKEYRILNVDLIKAIEDYSM